MEAGHLKRNWALVVSSDLVCVWCFATLICVDLFQVGLTDRESYIHRLGRTARAGESGQGVLLLAPFEQPMLNQVPVWRWQQLCS